MRRTLLLSVSLSALLLAGTTAAWAQMEDAVKEVKPAIEKKAEAVVEKVEEAVAPVQEKVEAAAEAVTEKVEEKAKDVVKATEEKVEEVKETVKTEAAKAEEKAEDVVKATEEKVEDVKETVKEEAVKAEEKIEEKAEAATPAPAIEAKMPTEPGKTYMSDVLAKDGDVETFMELLKEAGLDADVLAPASPHTLFIPTDDAFDDLPSDTLKQLRDPENKQKLIDILNLHIVSGRVTPQAIDNNTSEVLTSTLKRLRVVGDKGKFTVNGIDVQEKVTETDDGVIYKINKVITSEAERAALPFAPAPQPPAPGPDTSVEQKAETPEATPQGSPVVAAPAAPEAAGTQGEKQPAKPWYKFW